MESKESPKEQAATQVAVVETITDKITEDAGAAVSVPESQEGADKELESKVDTTSETNVGETTQTSATETAEATTAEATETAATKTIEAAVTEYTEATATEATETTATEITEATATKGEEIPEGKSDRAVENIATQEEINKPSDSAAADADVKAATDIGGPAEPQSDKLEAPREAEAPTIQEQLAPEEPSKEVKSVHLPVTDMTAPAGGTEQKPEEQMEALLSEKAEADTNKPEEDYNKAEAAATDDAPVAAAPAPTIIVEDTKEAPKEETVCETVEELGSKVAPAEAASNATVGVEDTKEETAGGNVQELASEIPVKVELTDPSSVAAPVEETNASSIAEIVKEPEVTKSTHIEDKQEKFDDAKKVQEPILVESAENVKADEAKPSEGQEGIPRNLDASTIFVEAQSSAKEKTSEAEVAKGENKEKSSSNDTTSSTEGAAVPAVVEEMKKRTLEGLLLAEKNTEKIETEKQSIVDDSAPAPAAEAEAILPCQEEKPSDAAEDADDKAGKTPESDENADANDGDALKATETAKDADVKDSTTTKEAIKEQVQGTEAAAQDRKEAEDVTQKDLGEFTKEDTGAQEKGGEADKAETTHVKPSHRHSNNIMSKVKQSIVKVKKAIIGKSPSSKNMTPPVEKDDIKVK